MPTIIKHGDFTFDDEKIEEIAKNIEVANKKKAFLGQFCSPNAPISGDRLTKRRQVLLDPQSVADLNEGQTPREDSIKLVVWSQALRSYGSYIRYTRQAYKKNRDSVVDMARRQLAHNRLFDIEQTRFAALNSATHSIDAVYDNNTKVFDFWTFFTNAKVKARKNRVKGKLVFLCTPEIAAKIVAEAKAANSLLQGTADGAELIREGYLGDYNGVHIVECAEDYMYVAADGNVPAKQLAFFIGHTEDGQWPIVENKLSEGNIEVISKEIGSAGTSDPTNEVGTIAARIDDVGAFLEHPECVFKVANIDSTMVSAIGGDLPADYKLTSAFQSVAGLGQGDPSHTYGQGGGLHSVKMNQAGTAEASDSREITSPVVG